jgi:hypothetical protein
LYLFSLVPVYLTRLSPLSVLQQSCPLLDYSVKDLKIIDQTAKAHDLDLRSTKIAKAVYQHYDLSGYGDADMSIGCRYYSTPSQRVKKNKKAGVTRETSWAWADIYEGGGTVS